MNVLNAERIEFVASSVCNHLHVGSCLYTALDRAFVVVGNDLVYLLARDLELLSFRAGRVLDCQCKLLGVFRRVYFSGKRHDVKRIGKVLLCRVLRRRDAEYHRRFIQVRIPYKIPEETTELVIPFQAF